MYSSISKTTLCATLTTLILATHTRAEGDRILEEVIVTAEKRSENVQDVPISIAVVSGDEISIPSSGASHRAVPSASGAYCSKTLDRKPVHSGRS